MNVRPVVLALALLAAPAGGWADGADPRVELGRQLFFDPGLSNPPGQSCATCHAPGAAFTDPDTGQPTSKGVHPDRFGSRNTPSAMYMRFSPTFHYDAAEKLYVGGQFWDGRAATLEEQAKGPFLNPVEMANPDAAAVVDKVRRAAYADRFEKAFGPGALADVQSAYNRIAMAIAAFERSAELSPFSSRYDAWLAGRGTLSEQELRGLKLFEDEKKGNCAACHTSRPGPKGEPPLFTDFTYDNLGVPRNLDNPHYRLPKPFNPDGAAFVDPGLGGVLGKPEEMGKFKVPTLRNIALTAPYMHNGYFKTLRGVVAFYNDRDVKPRCKSELAETEALAQGCWPAPELAHNVNTEEMGRLGLSEQEVDDIVAFMATLTDR